MIIAIVNAIAVFTHPNNMLQQTYEVVSSLKSTPEKKNCIHLSLFPSNSGGRGLFNDCSMIL